MAGTIKIPAGKLSNHAKIGRELLDILDLTIGAFDFIFAQKCSKPWLFSIIEIQKFKKGSRNSNGCKIINY